MKRFSIHTNNFSPFVDLSQQETLTAEVGMIHSQVIQDRVVSPSIYLFLFIYFEYL